MPPAPGASRGCVSLGEAKNLKQLYQSERTGDQASIDSDVDVPVTRLRYEGTKILLGSIGTT